MRHLAPRTPPQLRLAYRTDFEALLSRSANISVILLGCLAVIFVLYQGKFLLAPVGMAVVVGLMLGPLASRLEGVGLSPWISSALVFLLVVGVVWALVLALWVPLAFWIDQAPEIWEQLQFRLAQLREPVEAIAGLRDQLREVTGETGLTVAVAEGSPVEDIALFAPAFLAQLLLFLASLFFFVATRHQIRTTILGLLFSRRLRWRVAHVFRDVEALVSRYLLSIGAINLGLGVAVTLALWALGVPSPALWGALAGLLNFVMYIGPAITAAILFAIGLATTDTLAAALVPPLVYLTLNMIEAQFVTPAIVGRTLTLNPFAVLLALSFWIWLWGPIGGFIAIPAMLVVIAITRNVLPTIDVDGSFR